MRKPRAESRGLRSKRYREIRNRLALPDEAMCFVGDDVVDVGVLRQVGLGVAPADAAPEAREAAHWVASRRGGDGVVREVVDLLLHVSGKWQSVTDRYLKAR